MRRTTNLRVSHALRSIRELRAPLLALLITAPVHGRTISWAVSEVRCTDSPSRCESIVPASSFALELVEWCRGSARERAAPPTRRANQDRIELSRPGIVEWYEAEDGATEHGFTLDAAPLVACGERNAENASEPLVLVLRVHGGYTALASSSDAECVFRSADGESTVLYSGLATIGADGSLVPSRMRALGDRIAIEIDDAGARYPIVVDPWILTHEATLLGSDTVDLDGFGRQVAISEGTVVVAAAGNTHSGVSFAGAAYVFVRAGTTWTEQAKLSASDPEPSAQFGSDTDIQGDTIVVGASSKNEGSATNAGAVYVFARSGSTWTQQAKLIAGDPASQAGFGERIGVFGDTIAIGAPGAPSPFGLGAVYVFVRNGTTWTQQAKLVGSAPKLGSSVPIYGDRIIAGAPEDPASGLSAGSVVIFARSGAAWTQEAYVSSPSHNSNAFFGAFLSMWEATVAISAPNALTGVLGKRGRVYVFARAETSWTQVASLVTPDIGNPASIAGPVRLRGDRLAVGTPSNHAASLAGAGKVYLFEQDATGWHHTTSIVATAPRNNGQFGAAVAQESDTLIVGGFHEGSNAMKRAYVYRMRAEDAFCFGDGSLGVPCPCSPPDVVPLPSGGSHSGCANALHLDGARLGAGGLVQPDTLTFRAYIGPDYGGFALLVKGDGKSSSGIASDDGIRCVDGALVRFGAHNAGTNGESLGAWTYPTTVQTTAVSVATGQSAGHSAYYQVLYRQATSGFCSPATANWTNAVRIDW